MNNWKLLIFFVSYCNSNDPIRPNFAHAHVHDQDLIWSLIFISVTKLTLWTRQPFGHFEMGTRGLIQYCIRCLILISRRLEGMRSGVKMLVSLWNVCRHLSSTAAKMPAKFQSNWKTLTTNLTLTRLREILRWIILYDIESSPQHFTLICLGMHISVCRPILYLIWLMAWSYLPLVPHQSQCPYDINKWIYAV